MIHDFRMWRDLRISRFIVTWLVLLALGSAAVCEEEPFNVDFFCGWGGHYRPMEWTPVEIGITGTLTEPFAGSVTIAAQQDGLTRLLDPGARTCPCPKGSLLLTLPANAFYRHRIRSS